MHVGEKLSVMVGNNRGTLADVLPPWSGCGLMSYRNLMPNACSWECSVYILQWHQMPNKIKAHLCSVLLLNAMNSYVTYSELSTTFITACMIVLSQLFNFYNICYNFLYPFWCREALTAFPPRLN